MYDNIRPLNDSELPQALAQIAASPLLAPIAKFLYPERDPALFAKELCAISDIHTLQDTIMRAAINRILSLTVTQFTHSGVEKLSPHAPYLFISNHRDITLDAFLLQYLLFHHNELYITFGANLMQDPIISLMGRANRMFRVERGGTPKEFYHNMTQVSSYIRHVIVSARHSVWIAQRNGRTKDGIDTTEVSLLKMLALSGRPSRQDPLSPLKALNLVPVSISYEWEPCDILKTRELYSRAQGPYRKAPGEDINSVLTGILQPKGHVHLAIADPLSAAEIDSCSNTDSPFENLAALIDRRIRSNYFLHPTNYAAYDYKHNSDFFAGKYTPELRNSLLDRISSAPSSARHILVDIYANPIDRLNIL